MRLLLSGTLERADGRAVLWLPYRRGKAAKTREVALEAPGWAVVGYSRAQALAEKAVLPVDFGALDGEAEWLDEERRRLGPHRISGSPEVAKAALFTALRTGVLWSPSYFAASTGGAPLDVVRRYVEQQRASASP